MLNRALFALAGFACLCFAFCPPELRAADPLNLDGITLAQPFAFPQSLSLDDRQTFFFSSSFGWMEPTQDFLPTFKPAQPRSSAARNTTDPKNFHNDGVELRPADRLYVGGEIGFLYGSSSGKYGGDYYSGYIIGELGNDKFHLTVGTSYERYNWRSPRWGH